MKKDTQKTKVLFKILKDEVIALFPEMTYTTKFILSYMHNGQHSEASETLKYCKNATKEQYNPLKKELENIGYNLTIA
jgi:hypothetical protein